MDWEAYKIRCDAPDVVPRWLLEQTRAWVDDAAREWIDRALAGPVLAKPADHVGDPRADMFELDWPRAIADGIRGTLITAIGQGARTDTGRDLGGFVEAWSDYARHLDER